MTAHTPLSSATEPDQPPTTNTPSSETESPINRRSFGFRYSQAVIRARWLIILLWIIGFAASLPFSAQVTQHLSSGGFEWTGSESSKAGDIISQKFAPPRPAALVVFQAANTPVTDPAFQREVQGFIQAAQGYPNVAAVIPNAQPSQDGMTTYVKVEFTSSYAQTQDAMPDFQKLLPTSGPAHVYLTGDPAVYNQIFSITKTDLTQSEEFTLPVAGIALLIIFGTLVATAIPLGLALLAAPMVLAVIYAVSLHTEITIYVVNVTTIIGLGLSIDYSLFLVRRFRDELRLGRSVNDAVGVMVATSGEAILFSGLTVLIGFSALGLVGLPFMTSIAIGGAVLALVVVLGALTLLPAVLSVLGHKINALGFPRFGRRKAVSVADPAATGFWHRWALGVMNHPWTVIVGVLLVLGVLAFPLLRLQIGLPGSDVLPPSNAARHGEVIITQQFPQTQVSPVIAVVQTRDGSPMLAADNIQQLCDLTRQVSAIPGQTSVIGLTADPATSCAQYAQLYSTGAYQRSPQAAQLVR